MKNPVLEAFDLPNAPVVTTRAARGTGIAFLELTWERRDAGVIRPPTEDAFLIALQLKKSDNFDLYADSRLISPQGYGAGDVAISDLRMNLVADLRDPLHAVSLYVPHRSFLALGDDGDLPRNIQELRHTAGVTVQDPVARDLLLAMRPALARPEETSELFVEYVALALSIHVADKYGDAALLPRQWGGGLASWQERRAKELIDAHLSGGITLKALAHSCGLSARHFTRAFRQSTGMAPHQWLQYRRLEAAKQLLDNSPASLSEIALECGFADQSHFTRTFSRVVGGTPRTWRRTRRG